MILCKNYFDIIKVFKTIIYKEGLNRKQQLMFPPSLDELVSENNIVRAIEEYVNIASVNLKTKKKLDKR